MRLKKKVKKKKTDVQKEGVEKKKRVSKTFIIGAVIIAVMVLSTIGFMWESDSNSELKYNGFKFKRTDNYWYVKIEGKEAMFYNHPLQLETINITEGIKNILRNSKMQYMTSDPEDTFNEAIGLVEYDLLNTAQYRDIYFVYAFTKENPYNKTIINCINATIYVPVLYFKSSNETQIS
ncbi:MAG: hypothetical protein N3D84_03560, partial [Candidatus Woesearchaeota archaeon]|nr:hypothetical protein [Candidatus Woesearchaeota archaeon]